MIAVEASNAPSKDAAAEMYIRGLSPYGDVVAFPITALDTTGIPAWCASLFLADGGALHGYGFGEDDSAARVGALGELAEQLRSRQATAEAQLVEGSYNELLSRGNNPIDPRTLGLPLGSDYGHDTQMRWVGAMHMLTDQLHLVPVEWTASSTVDLPMDYRPLITPITNGLGAGTTLAMAAEHSMLELLQRDGNGLSIRALDAGVRVALPDNVPPAAARLLRALRAADVNVMVKLTSTDFGLTGLCVVGRAAHDDILTGTACGEAVHADPGTALVKALAEFAGARARKRAMHGPLAALDRVAPPGYVGRCLGAVDLASDEGRLLTAMGSWLDDDPSSVWDQLERTVFAVKSTVPLPAATRLPNTAAVDHFGGGTWPLAA